MELARHPFLSPVVRWLVGSLTALLLTLPALEGLEAATPDSSKSGSKHRALSFEERVAAQKAIEEVLWRHRIWPKENPGPKPLLEKVLPDTAIREKVTDYLKKSNALAKFWNRPLAATQLQAEMERMAKNSRQPEVLREIFAALHDNPFLIAETLARPALAGRILRNAYATDRLFHQVVRAQAEKDVARFDTPGLMRAMQGEYHEKTWFRADPNSAEQPSTQDRLTPAQFDALLESLKEQVITPSKETASPSEELPIGRVGPLRETEDSFLVAAVLFRGSDSIRVASVTWSKKPFENWWKEAKSTLSSSVSEPGMSYESVSLDSAGCTDDTWRPTGETTPAARGGNTAVWTGSEMIVWGGATSSGAVRSGSRYNPAIDIWTPTFNDNNSSHVPAARMNHVAVWTGSKMVIWSGVTGSPGGIYDPLTDSWDLDMGPPSTNPTGRSSATAVWTGTEMIVWGGQGGPGGVPLNTGGRFDPATRIWTPTSTGTNLPVGRYLHSAIWTGSEMIVWGGVPSSGPTLNTGGRYNPATNTWTSTSVGSGVPSGRMQHTAIWTGAEMIVWGGRQTSPLDSGARYDPSLDAWNAIPAGPDTPSPRYRHTAVWTGTQMIVWGGMTPNGVTNTGSRYDPSTGSWSSMLSGGPTPPQARDGHTAVWTGTEMIVWGGGGQSGAALQSGGRYTPQTDSWFPTALVLSAGPRWGHSSIWTGTEMIVWGGGPSMGSGSSFQAATATWEYVFPGLGLEARYAHTAVWTGTEMIIWGGYNGSEISTGGRFNPATGVWTLPSNEGNVPSPRQGHTAVWTGTGMVIWGGSSAGVPLGNGSRYDPSTNSWTSVSNVSAPSPRAYHTAVWTGNEMIIWGGSGSNNTPRGDGTRYDPSTDSWTPVSNTSAPSPRAYHTAVWTGNEMIIWGGLENSAALATGGRYEPATDSWSATSPVSMEPRAGHSAVWTGHEMIVFGGGFSNIETLSHARYNPSTDSWRPISNQSTVSLPRSGHTSVWTGEEMIVYGGTESQNGARYCRLCPALYTYYADQDGDTFGNASRAGSSCDATPPSSWSTNATDCSDTDGAAWGSPAEVTGLHVGMPSPTEVTWDSQSLQSGTGTGYDIVGGHIFSFLGFQNFGAGSCLQAGSSSSSFIDPAPDPGPDVARWYLTRARNSCGIGTYGTGSFGLNRDSSIPACP